MGHITRISIVIESEAEMNKDIRTALDECPEWKEYAQGDLEESRNRERGSAVNRADDGSSRGSSDDEEGQEGVCVTQLLRLSLSLSLSLSRSLTFPPLGSNSIAHPKLPRRLSRRLWCRQLR